LAAGSSLTDSGAAIAGGGALILEPRQHVQHMLAAGPTGFQGKLHGHHHASRPCTRDGGQHVRHHPVAARLFEQMPLQTSKRFGHLGKGRAVPERAGFALDQPM
jgi:hypothetical protein